MAISIYQRDRVGHFELGHWAMERWIIAVTRARRLITNPRLTFNLCLLLIYTCDYNLHAVY